jgi:hypothetical protein
MLSYLTFLCCEDPYGGPENLLDICIVVVLTKKEKVKYQLEQYKTTVRKDKTTPFKSNINNNNTSDNTKSY